MANIISISSDIDSDSVVTAASSKAVKDAYESLDSKVVHISGNETVNGLKIFTSSLLVSGASSTAINVGNSSYAKGDLPTANVYHQLNFVDITGTNTVNTRFGNVEMHLAPDGLAKIQLRAYKNIAGVSTNAMVEVVYPASGNPYATAPNPDTSSNTNHIATTKWVNDKLSVVAVSAVSDLSSKGNGWYSISSATISGVSGAWTIQKMGGLYTATNTSDPRVVLNSTDLTNWYSPYAYWHA